MDHLLPVTNPLAACQPSQMMTAGNYNRQTTLPGSLARQSKVTRAQRSGRALKVMVLLCVCGVFCLDLQGTAWQ